MKNIPIASFLLLICLTANAQAYWVGGADGRENDWMEPRNWSTGQVPGWQDVVIIPYQEYSIYPEVRCVVPLIQSLQVSKEASVTISPEGVLTIDAFENEGEGILLEGFVFNYGALILTEMELEPVESQLSHLDNQGICSLVTDAGHIPLLAQENQ